MGSNATAGRRAGASDILALELDGVDQAAAACLVPVRVCPVNGSLPRDLCTPQTTVNEQNYTGRSSSEDPIRDGK